MKKQIRTILFVLVVLALCMLCGCKKTSNRILDMRTGQTREEVIKEMGKDYSEVESRMYYTHKRLLDFADSTRDTKTVYYLDENDKVYFIAHYMYYDMQRDFEQAREIISERYGEGTVLEEGYLEWELPDGKMALSVGSDFVVVGVF
ncbi:MAG: hypothetical protein Q4B67_08730 [Eubacteriales bacterium]|nr:hypothetical protein [Eubacteriales bacterium]